MNKRKYWDEKNKRKSTTPEQRRVEKQQKDWGNTVTLNRNLMPIIRDMNNLRDYIHSADLAIATYRRILIDAKIITAEKFDETAKVVAEERTTKTEKSKKPENTLKVTVETVDKDTKPEEK
tara:strand:+ start:2618 stop:2980 length:363 start_codon:yes stop_codon:yes gene_type:complete